MAEKVDEFIDKSGGIVHGDKGEQQSRKEFHPIQRNDRSKEKKGNARTPTI